MDDASILVSSHVSDILVARLIRKYMRLNVTGVELWTYEESLEPGLPVISQVRKAIRKASVVIFLISPAYLQSDEYARDKVMSNRKHHTLIPIVVQPCETSSAMNREMGSKRESWIDISGINDPSNRNEWERILANAMRTLHQRVNVALGRSEDDDIDDEEEEGEEGNASSGAAHAEDLDAGSSTSIAADLLDAAEAEEEEGDQFDPNFVPTYGTTVRASPLDSKHRILPLTKRQVGYVLKGVTIACAVVAIIGFVWFLMSRRDIDRAVFETQHLADKALESSELLTDVEEALNYTVEGIIATTADIELSISTITGKLADFLDQTNTLNAEIDAEIAAAAEAAFSPVSQFVLLHSKLHGLCSLIAEVQAPFINLTHLTPASAEMFGRPCSLSVQLTLCDALPNATAQSVSFCPSILSAQDSLLGLLDLPGQLCNSDAQSVSPLRRIGSSYLYKYALPEFTQLCAVQNRKGSVVGEGDFSMPYPSDGDDSEFADGRGDDLSSPEAFLRLTYEDITGCFGSSLVENSDAMGVYFEITQSNFDEAIGIFDGGCDGIGVAAPEAVSVPGLGQGWALRRPRAKVPDVEAADGFTFVVDSFDRAGGVGNFTYSVFVELYNCTDTKCLVGAEIDGQESGTMADTLRVCGRSLAAATDVISSPIPVALCCEANGLCGAGDGGCRFDENCAGELTCGIGNCNHDTPFLPDPSSRRCCADAAAACNEVTQHGHLNSATDSCCLVPVLETSCYESFNYGGDFKTCDDLNEDSGFARDYCDDVEESSGIDGLCAGCRCTYFDDEGVGIYDGADFDFFPHAVHGASLSCLDFVGYCNDPVYGEVVKAMCGTTCGAATGDGSPVCAAIPSAGYLSITPDQCTDASFSFRNTTSMQFGTALLNVSGQCCYEDFLASNNGSDFAGFDCAQFASALCGHPAYGHFMNAVCPDTCGACMDQLWTEVTNAAQNVPLPYDGMLTEDCAGVSGRSFLVVRDPTPALADWPSTPIIAATQIEEPGKCCDGECFICDYYFAYLYTFPYDYSVLSCPNVLSIVKQNSAAFNENYPDGTCENCACKLRYDDAEEYPGFYCQNE